MDKFTVNQLARMAGVSVRTLHHYDRIGLLKPAFRGESRYRYYGKLELLRLQQILFFKELDFPLNEIMRVLSKHDFDMERALHEHREQLQMRIGRMHRLLETIDKTLKTLKNPNPEKTMSNYDELYKGFPKEQVESWEKEVKERWGENTFSTMKDKVNALSKEQTAGLQSEAESINTELARLMDGYVPSHPAVQEQVARHYRMISHFSDYPEPVYRGLGKLYVDDERFTAYYEKYRPGLAKFLMQAIEVYCNTVLRK